MLTRSRRRASGSGPTRRERGFAVAWQLAWTVTVALAAGGAALLGAAATYAVDWALAVVVAASLVGAVLAQGAGGAGGAVAIVIWAAAGAVACQLTGGPAGPLAPWCLAPLAAGAAFGRPRLLALGAALGVAAAGVSALGAILLPQARPADDLSIWLSLLALATTALGLAAGLVALQGRMGGDAAKGRATETGLREALDHQPQLLLALDPDGRILEAFGEAPGGTETHDLPGRGLSELACANDRRRVKDALVRAVSEGSAEVGFIPASDPRGWLMLAVRPISATRLIAALRDAHAQRAREADLETARETAERQNAGKSRFLANMSHELRTPLNAIMGFSDIMRQRLFGPLSDRYVEYAELVHESGEHLLELINDVLDMSKIEAERFELARESFDVRDAVSAALRLMRGQAERAGIQLRGDLTTDPLAVSADRRAIKQIAFNLISNALKFTPRGQSVTVTVRAGGEMLEIVVADSGVGIAPQDLERLGKPFEQAGDADRRQAGSGLGLSLVRAFARLHGGDMVIESVLGEGTTVTVRMPVLRPVAPAALQAQG